MALDVADRVALRALVEAYASCVDRRDAVGFADLFVDDATLATFDAGGAEASRYEGRAAIATIPDRLRRYDVTAHLVAGHDLHRDAGDDLDELHGVVACEAHHVSGTVDRVLMIRYVDRYRREERWRFVAREVRVLWAEQRAVER